MLCSRTAAGAVGALVARCVLATSADAATPPAMPQPPSIASSLSPAVASVPGIVGFLQSSAPKTVETVGTTAVSVTTGEAIPRANGGPVVRPSGSTTVAGTWMPITDPTAAPGEKVGVPEQTMRPDISSHIYCNSGDFCIQGEVPYADYGFYQPGAVFVNIPHRIGYNTGKWNGWVATNVGSYPDYGPNT